MKKMTLATTERHLKDRAMIRHSQHRFPNENLFMSFYSKITYILDIGKVVVVSCFGFW